MRPVKRARVDHFLETNPISIKIFSYIAEVAQLSLREISHSWKASVDGYLTLLGRDIAKAEGVGDFSQTAMAIWFDPKVITTPAMRVCYVACRIKKMLYLLGVTLSADSLRGFYNNSLASIALRVFYKNAQATKVFPGRIPVSEMRRIQALEEHLLAPGGRMHRIGYLYHRGIFDGTILSFFRTFHPDHVLPVALCHALEMYKEELLALSSVAFVEQYRAYLPSLAAMPTAHLSRASLEDLKKGYHEILEAIKRVKKISIKYFNPKREIYCLPPEIVEKLSAETIDISGAVLSLPPKRARSISIEGFFNPSFITRALRKLKITRAWQQDWECLKMGKFTDFSFQDAPAPPIRFLPLCLVNLNLRGAHLRQFPDIRPLKKLERVCLSNNSIEAFPKWIDKVRLKRLDMSFNTHLDITRVDAIRVRIDRLDLAMCTQIKDESILMLLNNAFIEHLELEANKYIHFVLKTLESHPGITKKIRMISGNVPLEVFGYETLPDNVLYH